MLIHIIVFLTAFSISLLTTPLFIKLAVKFNITDHPNYRKIHRSNIPLLGGLAIFSGFILSLMFIPLDGIKKIIFLGSTTIVFLGVIDDKVSLGARLKFILPTTTALILVFFGLRTSFLPNYYYDILNILFTFIWIIGIVNSFNYIDNMNGLSMGTAFINSIFFFIIAVLSKQYSVAYICLALAGSIMGFIPYNFPKARIFAGDAGSMFVGFIIATVTIFGTWKAETITTSLLIPLLIVGYPISDALFVSLLRIINNKKPWIGDKNHTSHRISALGFSKSFTVLIIWLINISFGILALILIELSFFTSLYILAIVFLLVSIIYLILSKIPFHEKGMEKEMDIIIK